MVEVENMNMMNLQNKFNFIYQLSVISYYINIDTCDYL